MPLLHLDMSYLRNRFMVLENRWSVLAPCWRHSGTARNIFLDFFHSRASLLEHACWVIHTYKRIIACNATNELNVFQLLPTTCILCCLPSMRGSPSSLPSHSTTFQTFPTRHLGFIHPVIRISSPMLGEKEWEVGQGDWRDAFVSIR